MTQYQIVLITVPNRDEATKLARGLVEEHLAACVNILPGVSSVYRWQGEICTDVELLLICKTEASRWTDLQAWVLANHSYDVPEVIQLPITDGSPTYLQWISTCVEN